MKNKILIIEDEPSIADNISYALSSEGFQVNHQSTGAQGLEVLSQEGDFDLVVLDVGLPDQSGFEVCKQLRQKTSIPVIFLTARGEEIDRVVGLEIGGDDYMVKPFSPRELVARVKAILRRSEINQTLSSDSDQESEPEPSPVFRVDEERRCVFYYGEKLELTRNEYYLLKVFIRRPGIVYSRDQLMDMAWEEPEASQDRTVDAHIKMLRAKLKKVKPDLDPIVTHRGLGYSLQEDLR